MSQYPTPPSEQSLTEYRDLQKEKEPTKVSSFSIDKIDFLLCFHRRHVRRRLVLDEFWPL